MSQAEAHSQAAPNHGPDPSPATPTESPPGAYTLIGRMLRLSFRYWRVILGVFVLGWVVSFIRYLRAYLFPPPPASSPSRTSSPACSSWGRCSACRW